VGFEQIEAESHCLADGILADNAVGFMHRDFQSRNILISAGRPYIIDFQGGRLGPAEYDLASLLIDPYVALPAALRETLRDDFIARYHEQTGKPPEAIAATYRLCALARNLQILGAFGFLATAKGKNYFADYIPPALASLQQHLAGLPGHDFPQLRGIADTLVRSTVHGL
jgi:aminoglycoside/choline kinase family phosphotransferase